MTTVQVYLNSKFLEKYFASKGIWIDYQPTDVYLHVP